jgi:hypothetical protein
MIDTNGWKMIVSATHDTIIDTTKGQDRSFNNEGTSSTWGETTIPISPIKDTNVMNPLINYGWSFDHDTS